MLKIDNLLVYFNAQDQARPKNAVSRTGLSMIKAAADKTSDIYVAQSYAVTIGQGKKSDLGLYTNLNTRIRPVNPAVNAVRTQTAQTAATAALAQGMPPPDETAVDGVADAPLANKASGSKGGRRLP